MSEFKEKYGPWGLVAGGAQGIGEAYSRYLAAQGLNVAVIDFSREALDRFAPALSSEFGIECLPLEIDLSRSDLLPAVVDAIGEREVGMLVYNAGLADVGPFYKADTGLEYELSKIAINVTGPFVLSYHFGREMLRRRRGGIVLMSSGAGLQGSPYYAHYSATKAYDIVLAEALWGEFKPYGVDVLACVAGMTLSTAAKGYQHLDTSTFQTTEELVDEAMAALGRQSTLVAGEFNRKGRELTKDLPREKLIEIMGQHAIENFLGGKPPEQNV
ncbi:MAG: SDR family NAD(P)-dependent oxidoreductase [Deltaproteobacteria bacterium]|jgi:short-subunit dehydrogenase|nr:SDR family NAD(P)-dependent oxidoreductase [Deltaproteobacteria bacterium]